MLEVQSILKKAAEKSGLTRVRYKERNIPTSIENITVFVFFGDHRSSFVLSSILLRRIKEEAKSSKYFILVSWPGHEGLFPYVDEYWQIDDEPALEKLKNNAVAFRNDSAAMTLMIKNLNQYFYEILTEKDLEKYYNNGIAKDFFDRFKHIKVSLPSIPSVASIGIDFSRSLSQKQSKVFIYPSKEIYSWELGSVSKKKTSRDFWISLVKNLISEKFFPVVYNDIFSYDISSDVSEDCLHLKGIDLIKVLSVMRSCDCVVDVYSGISRFALCARAPFVCLDERIKFNMIKDYEINDLCGKSILKEYIFGFGTILESGNESIWKANLFDHLIMKIKKIQEYSDRDSWPAAIESNEIVAYDSVRKFKNKRLGVKFIRVEKD